MKNITLFAFISLVFLGCNTTSNQVDLIVHNAKIYTVNDLFEVSEAMVIAEGKIVAIGAENEILNKYKGAAKEIIDAKKQVIYPGFIDAHCHFVNYAIGKNVANLIGTNSFEEVLDKVASFAKRNQKDWIVGRGWDQNDWDDKEFPTRDKLDSLFPEQPVVLIRIDGHAALVNQKALELAQLTNATTIDGGALLTYTPNRKNGFSNQPIESTKEVDKSTRIDLLTGVLIDNAIDLVTKHIPPMGLNDKIKYFKEAEQDLFEVGLTTIADAGLEKININLIDSLQQVNELKLKMYIMISGNENMLKHYLEKGPYKTDKLNVCSFKFYADGALGSRGACLIKPYSDVKEHDHHGLLLNEEEFFNTYAPQLYEKGFQMNTHCIGDSANRLILDVYGKVLKGVNDRRWRIEHAQVIHPNDFGKFREYTIIPSIQSTHATSDMYWAEDRLGDERVKGAYAYKDLLEQNGMVALGTDFPVEGINPMTTFYAAVVRKDKKGYPDKGYQMENSLTRTEALKGMTIWAALANFEENEKGSLEIGKAADFIIMDTDIMEAKEDKLLNAKVLKTFINGENVFSSKK